MGGAEDVIRSLLQLDQHLSSRMCLEVYPSIRQNSEACHDLSKHTKLEAVAAASAKPRMLGLSAVPKL